MVDLGVKMFEDFKRNFVAEKDIIRKLRETDDMKLQVAMLSQLRVLNAAVPELLKQSSPVRDVRSVGSGLAPVSTSVVSGGAVVEKGKRGAFEKGVKAVNRDLSRRERAVGHSTVRPSMIKNVSNRLFRGMAEKILPFMGKLSHDIKMANMNILPSTYVAIMLLFSFMSVFLGVAVYGVLLFLNLSYWIHFWVIFAVPIVTFFGFYFYPQSESGVVQKAISYELPFATIHMTAIAGSNIEPTKIFQIISESKEYPNVGREMQKVLVLIRVYGYDLVTSLKDVAKRTSNNRFAELLGGLATNISGGGELKTYLEKKSENFLLDYRLERKKYIDLASTFMDIYISILIAAPMVLMLMFIVMNVAGLGFEGFSIQFLLMISILVIIVVNILFLVVINLKQPKT
jgi:archaellum biogenesis protein FlaJ (TadC family)